MTLYKWSQTASADATADSTINWAEGQAPSSVNDSARAMMAATAKYRDDIAGAIVTAGSSTAYTVSSYQMFDTLTHLSGQMIAFTPHVTNAATVTLNVDGLGARPLRTAPNAELLPGVIVQGTPYVTIYNNTDDAFYLRGFYGNPYNIPLGAGIDYWGATAPNSCFVFPIGQAVSRTIYATLFSLVGTTYGAGDGSTTFNLPDKRGRVSAALDPSGSILTSATISPNANTLGSKGGEQAHPLSAGEIPTITGVNTNTQNFSLLSGETAQEVGYEFSYNGQYGAGGGFTTTVGQVGVSGYIQITPNTLAFQSNNTGNSSHNNVQPTIMCNYILRII